VEFTERGIRPTARIHYLTGRSIMNNEPKHPLMERMQENKRLVDAMFERMLKDGMEFAELVYWNQTTSYLDKKKPRDDDWNVDNR
jgi:hypothetical protein